MKGLSVVKSEFSHILKNALTKTPPSSISKLHTALSSSSKNNTPNTPKYLFNFEAFFQRHFTFNLK